MHDNEQHDAAEATFEGERTWEAFAETFATFPRLTMHEITDEDAFAAYEAALAAGEPYETAVTLARATYEAKKAAPKQRKDNK